MRFESGEELEPSNPRSRASWETSEYSNTNGLALINASGGYAVRTTGRAGGSGITVAVLDDGVDFSHPDLSRGTYDIQYAFEGAQLDKDHGTSVAGIIAARRDGRGIHGVAYNANIVSIGTCKLSGGCFGDATEVLSSDETAADIASAAGLTRTYGATTSTPDASSHIMNMSFIFDGVRRIGAVSDAMEAAADAGRIMVVALGNEQLAGPGGVPATNVADSGIAGNAIAVGSLNRAGNADALHSNLCGPVQQYCMFAPGERVNSTQNGGGYGYVSGTSFAAPHVAGAAAAVWAAFPNKSGSAIVRRLLTTARPLDGVEISPRYGHGALDLQAALNPVGFLSVPMNEGDMAPLADTFIDLPPGFGGPVAASGLTNTVVYDEQMFPFWYDLRSAFRTAGIASSDRMLREFLSSLGTFHSVSLPGQSASVEFVHDDDPVDPRRNLVGQVRDDEELHNYSFSFNPVPQMEVSIGQGLSAIGSSNEFVASRTRRTLFGNERSVGPFAAFAGRGLGMSLDWRWNENTAVDFTGKLGEGYFGSSSAQLASFGLTRRVSDGVTVGARYGTLRESGSQMGIRATEAFKNVTGAATDFLDLSVEGRVSDTMALFGSVSHGTSTGGTPTGASLVTSWSDMHAGSFVIGSEFGQIWRDSDRLTVTASSPFRARRATVHVGIPDREVADGIVGYTRQEIDLTPSGRERQLQLVYETGPGFGGDHVSLAIGGYVRVDPNHDADADTDVGAAAKILMDF